jgi:hypothetical protein
MVLLGLALVSAATQAHAADYWTIGNGPFGGSTTSFAVNSQGHVFVGTGAWGCNGTNCGRNGVFRSTDGGRSWMQVNNGLASKLVNSLVVDGADRVYGGTYFGGIFRTDDNGQTWVDVSSGLGTFPYPIVDTLAADSHGTLFAGTREGQIFRSSNQGGQWTEVARPLTNVLDVFVDAADTVFAGGIWGAWRSPAGGGTWTPIPSLNSVVLQHFLSVTGGTMLAGSSGHGAFRSVDGGFGWQQSSSGLAGTFPAVWALVRAQNGDVLAAAGDGGLYRSTNGGASWVPVPDGPARPIDLVALPNGTLLAQGRAGIHRSTDNGSSWVTSHGGYWNTIVRGLAVEPDGAILAGSYSGVFRSSDGGRSWSPSGAGLPPLCGVSALVVQSGRRWAGTTCGDVHQSDDGITWIPSTSGAPAEIVSALVAKSDTLVLASTREEGIFRSTDGGAHWTPANSGLDPLGTLGATALGVGPDGTLYAGVDARVYRSRNDGLSWHPIVEGFTGYYVTGFAFTEEGHVLAGTSTGLFRSVDRGEHWELIRDGWVTALGVAGRRVFMGEPGRESFADRRGVQRFEYDGSSLQFVCDSLTNNVPVAALSFAFGADGTVYAGLDGAGVATGPAQSGHLCGASEICQHLNEGSSCDDGDACTQTDRCEAGECVGEDPVVCPSPGECQEAVTCDPATGQCAPVAATDGTMCTAPNVTDIVGTCIAGGCTSGFTLGLADPCDDPLPPGFRSRLARSAEKVRRLLEKAQAASRRGRTSKAEALRRRTLTALERIVAKTSRAARARSPRRVSEACRAAIEIVVRRHQRAVESFVL